MAPEEIRKCLTEAYREIHAEAIKSGYSFWLGPRAQKNRILRASRDSPSSPTKLKLAVTERLPDLASQTQVEFSFSGDRNKLLEYAAEEIRLYRSRIE